ncbi:MAG TPA: TfoX/Sxy family protein [Nocardioidaceae bacterium]|nr:TfoX/Sxy family protein [Nocardioidaceae bacterium]
MAYDEQLADRIRDLLTGEEGLTEQRMFGGLAFLVNRNMAVAVSSQGGLLVRADPDAAEAWMEGDHVAPMEMRGRSMKGWLRVAEPTASKDLELWVQRGVEYAKTLPPKE